jgi:hypothetical protein
MPKTPIRDNQVRRRRVKPTSLRGSSHIPTVGEVLDRLAIARQDSNQDPDLKDLLKKIKSLAGDELADHLQATGRRGDCLLVWVDNALWSARARYLLEPQLALLQQNHPWLGKLNVRVVRTPMRSAG